MNILYIEPSSGISGDMIVSALIHAGFPVSEIEKTLSRLPIKPPKVDTEEVSFGVFSGIRLKLKDEGVYLSPNEMVSLIKKMDVEEMIKRDVEEMINILITAEAKIHGVKKEEVSFHELSSVDTFLDFLLVACAIRYFRIDKVFVGKIPHGAGFLRTSHGTLPNPPPLTLEILKGFSSRFTEKPYELTTPTGATIIRHYVNPEERFEGMRILFSGCGVGNYEMEEPDILRVYIGKGNPSYLEEEVSIIEFDVDDMEMEYVGLFAETLRRLGVIEVVYFPVFMKKGRVGIRFSIIVKREKIDRVIDGIFENSSTFGLRIREESRRTLKREEKILKSRYGEIRIKVGIRDGKVLKTHVEFEDVKKICEETGIPYTSILKEVREDIDRLIR